MFKPKITLEKELYDRLTKTAEVAGYSSTEEFILHILETAAPVDTGDESEEAVRKRLQGLGYIE